MNNYVLMFNSYMMKENKDDDNVLVEYSDDLIKLLNKIITDPIASKMLKGGEPGVRFSVYSDCTYLDIEKDSKVVSYLPANRIDKVDKGEYYTSEKRQSMSWGKMINKLFPGEFTNMDIDRFYNRYRPEIDVKEKEKERFKLVHGEDIRFWYHYSHWDGSFGSCMQGDSSQPYFDIYCNNPEKCGLLIYFSEKNNDKIIGRALVWNNLLKPSGDTAEDKNPYTLLDRVYYLNNQGPQIEAAFHKYAIDHGWLYRVSIDQFYLNGVRKTSSVATRLKPIDYKYYPYVDTMRYYTPATGRAASTPGNHGRDPNNPSRTFPRFTLQNQNGAKSPLDR
jgi:hypothetical protein